MEPLGQTLAVLFFSGAAYSNNQNNFVHDIRRKARGYDSQSLQGYRILRRRINPSYGRATLRVFCGATQSG
jgi:hypothetical protein